MTKKKIPESWLVDGKLPKEWESKKLYTYVLLHSYNETVDSYYFKCKHPNLNGLSFGGEDFTSQLLDVDEKEYTTNDFERDHHGWREVSKLIKILEINFDPRDEDVLIDLIPEEIQVLEL